MTAAKRKAAKSKTRKSCAKNNIGAISELVGNLEELNRWQCRLLQTLRAEVGRNKTASES